MHNFADMRAYWKRVHDRALITTFAMFPIAGDRKKLLGNVLIFVVASLALWAIVGIEGALGGLPKTISFLVAVVLVFAAFYAVNFIAVQHRMDREAREEIESLEQIISGGEEGAAIAQPLRRKLKEAQAELANRSMSAYRCTIWANNWEQAVLDLMRKDLPEHEIHMFESISTLPKNPSQYGGGDTPYEALNAKAGKLRQIVNRLLQPQIKD